MVDIRVCRVCGGTDEPAGAGGDGVCWQCATAVALIACRKSKNNLPLGAVPEELYTGRLLHRQLAYARNRLQLPDERIFILSAQYSLVALIRRLMPYERGLVSLPAREREMWGCRVVNDRIQVVPGLVLLVLMAGEAYPTAVAPRLDERVVAYTILYPVGLSIEQQVAWYKQQEVTA